MERETAMWSPLGEQILSWYKLLSLPLQYFKCTKNLTWIFFSHQGGLALALV